MQRRQRRAAFGFLLLTTVLAGGWLTFSAGSGAHASPVVVSWPALTLAAPVVSGACVTASKWNSATSRLSLTLAPGTSWAVQVTAG